MGKMRTASLEKGGEFSVDNMAYKSMRAMGYFDRVQELRTKLEDESVSL